MTSRFVILRSVVAVWLLSSCGDGDCPVGEERVGSVCIGIDAGADAAPDAGEERCSGVDDDGDGSVDEGFETQTFYADADGDDAGDPERSCMACSAEACGEGVWVPEAGDCDDTEVRVFEGAPELCNERDDDCDEQVDEGATSVFYADRDNDGFGDVDVSCEACSVDGCMEGERWVEPIDCNDECDDCFEGADEVCDGEDNDCDEMTDEGVTVRLFVDGDGDGFGTGEGMLGCLSADGVPPMGMSREGGDCADEDARANPGLPPTAMGIEASDYFTTPILGEVEGGPSLRFDYNCDGEVSFQHAACDSCQFGACYPNRVPGPACGAPYEHQPTQLITLPDGTRLCQTPGDTERRTVACR